MASLIDLDALVAQANDLAPLPASTVRLAGLVAAQHYEVSEVAEIVSYDPALTLKLIRCANSAFRAGSMPVTTAKEAVLRLGAAQVLALAVASHARPLMQKAVPEYQMGERELWRHSIAAALVAELMPAYCRSPIPPESFTAALLHDIGKLVMARFLDQEVLHWLRKAQNEGGLSALEAERQVLSVHHGELGGIVAQHWNMPERIIKGITYHHTPEEDQDCIGYVICLANRAAKVVEARVVGKSADITLETALSDRLGLTERQAEKLCVASAARFAEVSAWYDAR